MKQLKMTALALALTSIATGSAMAQSSKTNAWEGFYGQVGVGYGIFTPTINNGTPKYPGSYSPIPAAMSTSNLNNVNTGTANLAFGYNFGINESYILGLAATYYPGASSGATGVLNVTQTSGNPAYNALNNSTTATYNIKNLYSVVLTPGYAIDKDRLAYAKIGYTGATVGLSSPIIPYNSTNLSGLALGLGYKQMVSSNIYAFGEFNYATYGNANVSTITSTNGVTISGVSAKGTGMDFLVGLGYRF
jgi:outer membrane immunogenic protein